MRIIRCLPFLILLVLFCAPNAKGFHAPPWDTGHNSFGGDNGDDDTDPGDDGPCKSGSPVEVTTGNFYYTARDFFIAGLGPAMDLSRYYNARDMRSGPFGVGWVFGYDQRLVETTDEMQIFAICTQPNGKREIFTKNPDGSFPSPPHMHATLIKNPDGTYTLRESSGMVRTFNSDGRLTGITDRNGNTLSLTYDSTGFPTSLTDAAG